MGCQSAFSYYITYKIYLESTEQYTWYNNADKYWLKSNLSYIPVFHKGDLVNWLSQRESISQLERIAFLGFEVDQIAV